MKAGERDFNKTTIKALAKKGIAIVGTQWAPDSEGNFANGETVYLLDDNGCGKVRTHKQVRELVA